MNYIEASSDTPVAATVSDNSTNASGPAHQTVELSKTVNTTLALAALSLMAITYWMLTTGTLKLSNDIWLPSAHLEPNLASILTETWPERYTMDERDDNTLQSPGKPQDDNKTSEGNECWKKSHTLPNWALFLPRETDFKLKDSSNKTNNDIIYRIQGRTDFADQTHCASCDSPALPSLAGDSNSQPKRTWVRLRTPSPVMKTMVQISIWNHVSLWLSIAMVFNTLIYNGFLNKRTTDDSVVRLFLVCVYGLANLLFQRLTSTLLYRNFTFVTHQACWTLVCNTFVSVPGEWHTVHREPSKRIFRATTLRNSFKHRWATLNLELFGESKQSFTYPFLKDENDMSFDSLKVFKEKSDDGALKSLIREDLPEPKRDLFGFVNTVRDAKIKEYERSTESALEKVLANITVMLGICLGTGLASWTSDVKNDATTAQLGSYALLLSVSTGFLALISIYSQMTNATESAGKLLLLQEKTIEAAIKKEDDFFTRTFSLRQKPRIGFSKGAIGVIDEERSSRLSALGLLKLSPRWHLLACCLFSPALLFIRWHQESLDKGATETKKDTIIHVQIQTTNFRVCPGCGHLADQIPTTNLRFCPGCGRLAKHCDCGNRVGN